MSNELAIIPVNEIAIMAKAIANSGLFGVKTQDQALALMLIAQAEGRHPALAARDYDIIQGRPSKKSEAMQRDFLAAGGSIEWHTLSDTEAEATFSHKQGGTVRIGWNFDRAKKAGLGEKDMWKKYPRQMLRSRVVSEGIRTVFPLATSGMYVTEEVEDFDNKPVTIEHHAVAVAKEPEKKEPDDDIKNLTESAKAYAVEIELCDTEEKLHAVSIRFAVTMGKLNDKLPKWHKRLTDLLEKQRQSFTVQDDPGRNLNAG